MREYTEARRVDYFSSVFWSTKVYKILGFACQVSSMHADFSCMEIPGPKTTYLEMASF